MSITNALRLGDPQVPCLQEGDISRIHANDKRRGCRGPLRWGAATSAQAGRMRLSSGCSSRRRWRNQRSASKSPCGFLAARPRSAFAGNTAAVEASDDRFGNAFGQSFLGSGHGLLEQHPSHSRMP